MFRFKQGVSVPYYRQGYIYFQSRLYRELGPGDRKKIETLCAECGGEHWKALLEFVTTSANATFIAQKYNLGRETLYRLVRKYYESFPKKL